MQATGRIAVPSGYLLKDVTPTQAELAYGLGCISLRGTPHCSLPGHPLPLLSPLSPPPTSRRVCLANQEADANATKRPRGKLEFDTVHNIAVLKLPLELDPTVTDGYA